MNCKTGLKSTFACFFKPRFRLTKRRIYLYIHSRHEKRLPQQFAERAFTVLDARTARLHARYGLLAENGWRMQRRRSD